MGWTMRFALRSLFLIAANLEIAFAQLYSISTFAGGAPPPTPVQGLDISIGTPLGIASDLSGNVYFTSLNCVFRIDRYGIVTRVAGNSRGGYSGGGSPAVAAQLANPWAVAVDSACNVYVADSANNRVRRITSD